MGKLRRRALLAGGSAAVGVGVGKWLLSPTSDKGPPFPEFDSFVAANGRILNDASELEPTAVERNVVINSDYDTAFIHRVRALVIEAREKKLRMIASTARHSQGGHSLPENGIALSLVQSQVRPDPATSTYRVAAGTLWSTVVAELDKIGFSPKVMQSNNDFGVASTFSVNAHGWAVPYAGCGSTVRSIKMMIPDGTIHTCSRAENQELFLHAMGGYGLFGVILELELDMVPNARLVPTFQTMPGHELGRRFTDMLAADSSVQMAYGRLDVSLDRFLEEGILISYRTGDDQDDIPAASVPGFSSYLSRPIFRRQVGSDSAKHFRWWTETSIGPMFTGETTRNSLISEPVITMEDRDPSRTDILHEYFVPPERFPDFITVCREVIPASWQQLLNITVRYVDADHESILSYAPAQRISSVMLFSQEMTARGEADMARMTRSLIERVLEIGGTYYLPYRPHASLDQLTRAYPRAAEFVAFKHKIDPNLIFRNQFWERYLAKVLG